MTDRQLSDDRRLDEAIDRAVREMMNVEPRTDLRARVLAELGGPPARVSLWPRLAFAALTLAAAVTVLTIVQRPSDHPDAPQVASSLQAPIPSPQPAPGPTRPPTGGITSPPRAGSGSPSVSPGSSRPDPPPSNRRIGVQIDQFKRLRSTRSPRQPSKERNQSSDFGPSIRSGSTA